MTHSNTDKLGRPTTACRICGDQAFMLSTQLCDRCWELNRRIERNTDLALKILHLPETVFLDLEAFPLLVSACKLALACEKANLSELRNNGEQESGVDIQASAYNITAYENALSKVVASRLNKVKPI